MTRNDWDESLGSPRCIVDCQWVVSPVPAIAAFTSVWSASLRPDTSHIQHLCSTERIPLNARVPAGKQLEVTMIATLQLLQAHEFVKSINVKHRKFIGLSSPDPASQSKARTKKCATGTYPITMPLSPYDIASHSSNS
ncbi:hypothetical protein Agabi119p4_10597 [Agaricus bisporus var. burnettii]|uniref:Uncharacterized protein n=1 Tax=Agaricus bisporus var. burnettii TaxID=192524 RepID=A0A8H7C2V8_AGABI|nr:hypothetical protein Agabi119p4_10597 [Agaricus bisporus var. burnettii]